MDVKFCLRLCLGDQSKQARDERDLSKDVPFFHPMHLPFPKHMHTFVPLQRVPCSLKGKEAQAWFDEPFDEPMDNVSLAKGGWEG